MMPCPPTRSTAFPRVLSEVSLKTWEQIPVQLNENKQMDTTDQSRWMQNNPMISQLPEDFLKHIDPLVM